MDGIDQPEKYPPSFRVSVDTTSSKRGPTNDQELLNQQLTNTLNRPQCLFKDELEFQQTVQEYGKYHLHCFFLVYFYLYKKIFASKTL